ncbi:DapH/DapD/GlmU-related protein [Rhodococcus ruber]|uniref:DapH/DapD/GlmU-related protein n=1 Tax=Rhodococcus ruber TaxID=1830 RepID=UPI003B213EA0
MIRVPDSTASVRSLGARRGRSYDKGRGFVHQALWVAFSYLVFTKVWCPNKLRCAVLRLFGAQIGSGVWIRQDVRIQWPWKLRIDDNSWVGVGCDLYNIDELTIGSDVCISQQTFLCTGSHDRRSPNFDYDNGPITIENGVWVGARALVLRGVTIGSNSVVGAGSLVTSDVPPSSLVLAPPPTVHPIRPR